MVGAAYGFADVGPYNGGPAELLRVTCGDHNGLVLPEEARERRTDYVMLSGMFPTVWHAAELARRPGPGREGRRPGSSPTNSYWTRQQTDARIPALRRPRRRLDEGRPHSDGSFH
ncbi:hypothetical protein ACFWA5_49275 [Streptomyces mirabilis]|uniref:hypothetical protein n=1 Tax=Streptomyces mirabilis TaxID=68239 RepID=UPI003667243A